MLLWAVRMIRTGVERGYLSRLRAGLRAVDGNVLRVVALLAAGLGGFIVWSMWPRRNEV